MEEKKYMSDMEYYRTMRKYYRRTIICSSIAITISIVSIILSILKKKGVV